MKSLQLSFFVLSVLLGTSVEASGSRACLPCVLEEHCDMMELNHFYDEKGCHVFDQVIFYAWYPAQSKYHVRAWMLIEPKNLGERHPYKHHPSNLWFCRWYDSDAEVSRFLKSPIFRESWTQVDPERKDKQFLPEQDRLCLIKSAKQIAQDAESKKKEEEFLKLNPPIKESVDEK